MLEVDSLTAGYGETVIIRDLSMSVGKDEFVAVLGRNGMGKTTLLECLAGTLETQSGTVMLAGEDLTSLQAHERAREGITLIPQGREIFGELTVRENLNMGAYVSGKNGRIKFDDVFEYFPILEERLNQKGGTLSGGQQQMLTIARGLLTDPDLILLDEPSEGIQPSIIKELGDILPQIHTEFGIPIVLVEQNVELVRSTVDRAYILENGSIVEHDSIKILEDEGLLEKYIGV